MSENRIPEPTVTQDQLERADELIRTVDELGRDAADAQIDKHAETAMKILEVPHGWITLVERRRRFVAEIVAMLEVSVAANTEAHNPDLWKRIHRGYLSTAKSPR